ncbi:MAG: 4-phytase, partial [Anaerolineales bacterium]|nr:4-phytase [Anaerolineales bacterium]
SQTLLISGEPGIGKTRLVQELVALAEVSGGGVLQGWSYAQAAQPFGPIKQMIRAAFEESAAALASAPEFVLADLLMLAPEFHTRFPQATLKPSVDTAEERQRLFESTAVFLSLVSQEAPALIVLEDAHWADSATLHLLRYLVQQMGERRVMFVLTYRPVEPSQAPALYEVLHDFQREKRAHTLALARLDRAMTEGMLTALLGESVAPELGEEVYRVTEGNPFFIEEVSKGLAESGALTVGADGRWQAPTRKRLAIPVNVKVAIEGRLHLMPPETQRALEAAAIRGPRFEEEIVRQATQMEETAVVEALEAAERAKIIEEIPGDGRRFTFTHNLIPATIVDEMRASQRRSLHARVAPALAALRPEEFEALAYHYRQGGETGRAADYLLKAGERAYALYALPETIDNYTTALELLKGLKRDDDAARTLLRLGLVYSADFQFDKAQAAYEQAFDLWERLWRSEAPPESAASPVVLRYAVDEPLTLDPGMVYEDVSAFILGQLFEGLLEVDEATGVVPALARRWDVSDDGRRYTFHLRDGACWSDGSPLTAGDFEYAWKRNLGLGPGPSRLFLSVIAGALRYTEGKAQASEIGVQALDDRTLDVRLEQPAGFFPLLLAHTSTYPLPRRVVEGSRQPWTDVENLVGNGPYRLTEWRPGERMVFERNPYYRGLARGNVGRIEAPVIGDYGPLLELFDHDRLDGISLIKMSPGTFQQRVQSAYRRELTITPSLSTLYLAFRADRPPFDRAPVRKAFVHSIDRDDFVREAAVVYLRPAKGGFLPPGMAGHSASIGLTYDPDEARRLLAEAGYSAGAGFPEVELVYSGDASSDLTASYLAHAWEGTLGVKVRLSRLEWAELLRRGREDPPDLTISGWAADYPDADGMLRVVFHGHPLRWHNAEFDSIVEEAARIADRKRRIELYQKADRILVADEAAVLPLGYAQGRQLVKPYVRLPRTPPYLLRLKHAVVQRPQG